MKMMLSALELMAGGEVNRDESISQLQMFLADSYTLLSKTHIFQWNVTGEDAAILTLLFESQYKEMCGATDILAERIRMLKGAVCGGLRQYAEITILQDPPLCADADMMMRILLADHETLALRAHIFANGMMRSHDVLSADLMIQRSSFHEKQMRKVGMILGCGEAELSAKFILQKYAH